MLFVILIAVLRKKCHVASYLKNLSTGPPVARPRTLRGSSGDPELNLAAHGMSLLHPCLVRYVSGEESMARHETQGQ